MGSGAGPEILEGCSRAPLTQVCPASAELGERFEASGALKSATNGCGSTTAAAQSRCNPNPCSNTRGVLVEVCRFEHVCHTGPWIPVVDRMDAPGYGAAHWPSCWKTGTVVGGGRYCNGSCRGEQPAARLTWRRSLPLDLAGPSSASRALADVPRLASPPPPLGRGPSGPLFSACAGQVGHARASDGLDRRRPSQQAVAGRGCDGDPLSPRPAPRSAPLHTPYDLEGRGSRAAPRAPHNCLSSSPIGPCHISASLWQLLSNCSTANRPVHALLRRSSDLISMSDMGNSQGTVGKVLAIEKEQGILTATEPGKWSGKEGSHVPTVSLTDDGKLKVTLTHGMTAGENEHFIQYVYIKTDSGDVADVSVFKPTDSAPVEAIFPVPSKATSVTPFAYCNLHGVWSGTALAVNPSL
eukprot:scaffold1219_cov400-Prasinococcus_capsulatus_cf.AAC.9